MRVYGNIIFVLDDVMVQGMNNVDLMNLFIIYLYYMVIIVLFLL